MKYAVTVLVTAAVLAASGCGSPEPTPPAAASLGTPVASAGPTASSAVASTASAGKKAKVKAEDAMFLQMMVSQEQETAKVLDLVEGKSVSASTRNLTAAIRTTQADEAKDMVRWLRKHKQQTKADPDPAAHTHHGAPTGLTAGDLKQLRRAKGKDFERQLLNVLLGQQHNAIEMARTTADAAGDPWVKELAEQVDRSRTAQIAELLKMVAAVPAGTQS